MNQLQLIDELLALVIAGDDTIPSGDLMTHAMRQGWITKLSESFSVSHFRSHPPQNEAQKRLLKEVQLLIFRGYLRDSLPELANAFKKELRIQRLNCARRFAAIFTDPEGAFFSKEERRSVIADIRVIEQALLDQARGITLSFPDLHSDPIPKDSKNELEAWIVGVLNEEEIDVSKWVNSHSDEENLFVCEFAAFVREQIKPHEPDCQ